jgi:intracellular sulfur oxidation DsrE/DsrF family protein
MKKTLSIAAASFALAASSLALAAEGTKAESGTAGTSSPTAASSEHSRYGKQKVVYHINFYGAKDQLDALRNIQNHINAVGAENIDLKVVLHGDGLSLLLEPDGLEGTKMKEGNADEEMQARIAGLKQQGVHFDVCANTLKGRNVKLEDLYDVSKADIVPSGVAELARLEGMGYSYIKP